MSKTQTSDTETSVTKRSAPAFLLMWIFRLAAVLLTAEMAWIHFHLHNGSYQHIPKIGVLFLLNAIGGLILAILLLISPRRLLALVALLDLLFIAGTLAGLVVSIEGSLFQFTEQIDAPYVHLTLGVESAGILVAAVLTYMAIRFRPRRVADVN